MANKFEMYAVDCAHMRSNKRTLSLLSCFSSCTVNKCPFCGLFGAMLFAFLCFLLVILLFKIGPRHSAKVLSGVTKCKRAMMCLIEEIHVLDQLHSV